MPCSFKVILLEALRRHALCTQARQNSAPVRIFAVHGGFHERTHGHAASRFARQIQRWRASEIDFDQLARAFAIGRDRTSRETVQLRSIAVLNFR